MRQDSVFAQNQLPACQYISTALRNAVWKEAGVYEKDGIETPFVIGLCRPKIYLPPSMGEQEKRFVLEHERTHIRRRDHLVKQAAFLISCVHWFHPLVWLSFYLMCRDMEMSCDECVIRRMGQDIRKEYSAALLSLSSGRKVVLGSPLAFGENSIRSRIVNVLRYKKRAVWVSLALAAAIAAVTAGLALNPKADVQNGIAADGTQRTGQDVPEEFKNKNTSTKLENYTMASGVMPLADGTDVTVELCMTDGIYYDDTMEEYIPGIYSNDQNYEGNYALRTKNSEGEILYQNDLGNYWPDAGVDYEGGRIFNFPEKFPLNWTDYNADGCPDFTVGLGISLSAMEYLLFTVHEDGTIERICSEGLLNHAGEFSIVFEHDTQAEQMPILGYASDNTSGESGPVKYLYNAQSGMYEREPYEAAADGDGQDAGTAPEENGIMDTAAADGEIGKLANYEEYEGYLDEAPGGSSNIYQNLDFDQDGITDRVYRGMEGDTASFELRFGNGDNLFLGEFEKEYVFPSISAAEIAAGNGPVILFTANDIMNHADKETKIALYSKPEEHFENMDLLADTDGGPYLDSKEMRAGYLFTETYDAQKNKMQITFQDTDQRLEFTPEEEVEEDFFWQNDAAYSAQFSTYQGESCVVFCEKAYGKGPWADFCYVLAIRPSAGSDRNPYDLEMIYAGWTDELGKNGFALMN